MRNILRRLTRPIWRLFGYDAEFWRGPMLAGALVAAVIWIIWYYTKVPCTAALAAEGVCNPGALANYINVDIASRCTAAWLGTTTLTGGINAVMLERERQRTEEAHQELAAERKRYDERIQEMIEENREERRQFAADRQQFAAERQQLVAEFQQSTARQQAALDAERQRADATQQAMLDTMAQMSATMDALRRHNGNGSNGASASGDQP